MGKLLQFNRLMQQAAKKKGQIFMVQSKAHELLDMYNVIAVLARQETDALLALKPAHMLTTLAAEMDKIERERIKLCEQYGHLPEGETEGEKHYQFEPDQRALFDQEINELQNREVTLAIEKFTPEELKQFKATGAMLIPILRLVEGAFANAATPEAAVVEASEGAPA